MSSVDNRVVEMKFDNKDFLSRVSETIKSLANLKKSLKMDDSTKSLNNLEKKLNGLDMSTLSNGVQTIASRFSTMGVIATTALQNIANAAINTGTQLVKSLTLESAMSGFQEYETQMNSILTILNNTKSKGSTLDDVNAALNELNTYADQTIYNFTEMTQNIGRFTAAGVDLQTSVDSIKGLSNLAAFFGSSSQQASSAMYQLSQAIAAGRVSLMDWNSVVNAGMGGPEFQEALKRTAEHFGINVDGMIEKYGSFRESLTRGQWLTSDILTETLKQISGAYSESDLIAQGYTADQAKAITQLAADATDAATKVRTFTQLMSTIREQMGSGWTTSWQLIEGDFNEATDNWSNLYDKLSKVIQKSSDDRNALLQEWADLGGRTELWAGISAMFDTILSYGAAIKKGFQDIFPPATAQQLYDLTKGFHEFWENAILSSEASEKLSGIVSDFASVLKWVIDGITGATDGLKKLADGAGIFSGGLFDLLKSISSFLKSLTEGIDLSGGFSLALSFLGDTMSGIGKLLSLIGVGVSTLASAFSGALGSMTQGLANLTGGLGTASQGITEIILSIIKVLPEAIGTAISAIGDAVTQILDAVPVREVNAAIQDTLFTLILSNINKFVNGLSAPTNAIDDLFGKIGETVDKFGEALDAAKGSIKSFATSIKANALIKIAVALGILAASIKLLADIPMEQIGSSLGALAGGIVIMGAAGLVIIGVLKKMAGGLKGAIEIATLASTFRKIAMSMLLFAASIRVLADALSAVSALSWDEIFRGLVAIAGLTGVVIAASKLLDKTKGLVKTAASLIIFSGAIAILANALKMMADLDLTEIITGLAAIGGSAAILVAATKLMDKGASNFIRSSVILLMFSMSIRVMASAMKAFSEVGASDILKSIGALAGLMTILKLFSKTMGGLKIGQAISIAAVLLTFSVSLKSFAEVANMFNDIDLTAIGKMSLAVGVLMAELSLFSRTLKGNKNLFEVSGGIWLVVDAVNGLADALKKFAELSLTELAKGLIGIAGGLTIMLIAMKKMPDNTIDDSIAFIAVALSLKAMANAVKEFGSMDLPSIGRALLAFAGSMTVLSVAAHALKGTAGGSGSLALFALGISLLVGPIKALGDMNMGDIAKALISLATSLTIVGVASKILGSMSGAIVKTAGSLIVMGAAITVFGIGLTAMMFPIKQLAELDSSELSQGVVALAAVIGTLFALVNTMNALPEFSVKTVAKVALLAAVIAGVGAVIGQLASIDAASALQAATALSGTLVATSLALKVLDTVNVTGAVKGVATLAVIIGGMAAVVAAAGGLAQIPGAKWLVNEGAEFLASIGAAIGGFFGSIIGGVAGGAITTLGASLPVFGQQLSDFMTNASPFFSMVSTVNPESLTAIQSLAVAILALTGANVLEAATSWLTGGNTMVQFGQQLAEFAPYFKQYADGISGIDAASVQASATAAEGLAKFATSLPAEGGLLQKITGENDIASFGRKLAEFGPSFKQYASTVAGLDAESVVNSANAAKSLAEFANNLPAEGGWLQKITGENDIVVFGNKLKEFGPALKAYADSVAGLNGDVVVNSANAAKALAEVANNIPAEGGALQWFVGEKDLGSFGDNLEQFGDGMKKYGEKVAGIDPEAVSSSASAAQALVNVANNLENSGGVLEWFTGKKDLSGFGDNLALFGDGLSKYASSVADIDSSAVGTSAVAAQALVTLNNSLENSGSVIEFFTGKKDLGGFASNLEGLGQGIAKYANAVAEADFANVQTSANALNTISRIQSGLEETGGVTGWWSGEKDLSGFGENLKALGNGIKGYANAVADGDFSNVTASVTAVRNISNVVKNIDENDPAKLTSFSDAIKEAGDMGLPTFNESLANAATSAATNMTNLANSISTGSSTIVTAFDTLKQNLSNKTEMFGQVGNDIGTALKDKLISAINAAKAPSATEMSTMARGIIDAARIVFDNAVSTFEGWGRSLIAGLTKGMSQKSNDVSTTLNSIVGSIKVSNANSRLFSTGQDIINGLISGMKDRRDDAVNTGSAIGRAAANAVSSGAGVASPSKITIRTGKFVDEGLINGMMALQSKVRTIGADVGTTAVEAINQSASKFSPDMISSINEAPKIRPVIDFSQMDRTLFSSMGDRTISLSGNIDVRSITAANSVMADRIAREQQLTRESNQRVIDEISGLREDISAFMDADPAEIGLYVDGNRLASSLAKPMNRQLNIISRREVLSNKRGGSSR